MTAQPKSVYAKIAAVQGELAQSGIAKESENTFDRYKFRGIDAVYNALAPLLAKHGLCILPRIIERDCQERVSRKGEPMFYITVTAEFDFVSADDGSIHTIRTYGEAMDRSDKATNKAMSAAYKYAAFMAFAIPTEGDNDADSATPEVAPREQAPKGWREPDSIYSTPTKLHAALITHHAELERIGIEGVFDDLETYLTSPEYTEYLKVAGKHAMHYLDGLLPENVPPEFIQTFALEQKARDMIAIRGNVAAGDE